MSSRIRLKTTLALFGAALAANHDIKGIDVTPTQPLPELRTVCVGRLLFDLPVDIELKGDVELYYGLDKNFSTAMDAETLLSKPASFAEPQIHIDMQHGRPASRDGRVHRSQLFGSRQPEALGRHPQVDSSAPGCDLKASASAMTPAEAKQIETLTARMTTRYVGRYLIDLPDRLVGQATRTLRPRPGAV